jgi:hypothetical protein
MRLSPLRHGTDGFFAATLVRKEAAPKETPKDTLHDAPQDTGAGAEEEAA